MFPGTTARVALRPRRRSTFRLHNNMSMRKLHEFFVVVRDRPGASRENIHFDLQPPFYTFAGEILAAATPVGPGSDTKILGNAFACVARDENEIRTKMKDSQYYKQGIWELSTVEISPLETVHPGKPPL